MQQRLAAGELALSLALYQGRTADSALLAAACGFDALTVDLEHSAVSLETASLLCTAAIGAGITPMVRVASQDGASIARAFDIGAVGVIVPHVQSAAEATRVVEHARFPPAGNRSIFTASPLTRYEARPPAELLAQLQQETFVAAMVESPAAVEAIDDIAAVAGLDMIVVGPYDLSAEHGVVGRLDHPAVVGALHEVARACAATGTVFGVAGVSDPAVVSDLRRRGLQYLGAGTDVQLLLEAGRGRVARLRASAG